MLAPEEVRLPEQTPLPGESSLPAELETSSLPELPEAAEFLDPLSESAIEPEELALPTKTEEPKPSGRTQAAPESGQSTTEAGQPIDVAASIARPVSLTQTSLAGGTGPSTIPSPEGAEVAAAQPFDQAPLQEPTDAGGEVELSKTDVAAEAPTESRESGRSSPIDRAAPAHTSTSGGEALPTAVEGAPRREQVAGVQPKAGPAQAPPPPPSPEQAANVLRQFRLHLTPGMRQATIQLQPAALGRIAIRITMRNGEARTEIRAESPAALEALERHVPELRAALQGQGLEAGEIDLTLGFDKGDSNTPERFGDHPGANPTDNGEATPVLASETLTRSLLSETGVDTYA